jgi:hypothetical protein
MRPIWQRLLSHSAGAERFVLNDVHDTQPPPDPAVVLRSIAVEAVILQDQAEAALRDIRARISLGLVAPRAGPLVRRFFALGDQLPTEVKRADHAQLTRELAAILRHHAMALSVAMEFVALEWRSAAMARQIDALTDLGPPARRLDEICALLTGRS